MIKSLYICNILYNVVLDFLKGKKNISDILILLQPYYLKIYMRIYERIYAQEIIAIFKIIFTIKLETFEDDVLALTIWSPILLVKIWGWGRFSMFQLKPLFLKNVYPRCAL